MGIIRTEPEYWDRLYQHKENLHTPKIIQLLSRFVFTPKSKFELRIYELISDEKVRIMLEAGCGTGRFVFSASSLVDLAVGVDFSNEAINTAIQHRSLTNAKNNILFCLAEIQNLPFADNTFDLILSLGVIEHFSNPVQLLLEMRRVLKPEGILFLEVPNRKGFGRTNGWIEQSRKIFGYHDFYTFEELSVVAKKAGLSVNKAYSTDFATGVKFWYKAYIVTTYLSNKGVLRYINAVIGIILYLLSRPLNGFMKNKGFYSIVEAMK